MKAPLAFPFLRAAPSRVSAIWGLRPDTQSDLIPDWDPNTDIGVAVDVRVDRRGVLSDTDLAGDAPLALSLTWSSAATNASGVLRTSRLNTGADAEDMRLWGHVPGSRLAHAVDLSLTLHLAESIRRKAGSLAPWLVGSELWRDSRTYFVEGDAARFPLESRDFSQDAMLPSQAAWYLDWSPVVPTDSFLGSVRLYLNSSHPMIQRLTDGQGSDDSELAVLRSLLRTDVARQLIAGALGSDAFLEADEFEPGTVGYQVKSLIAQIFPGRRPSQMAAEMRERPSRFEALMQSRLRFLQS